MLAYDGISNDKARPEKRVAPVNVKYTNKPIKPIGAMTMKTLKIKSTVDLGSSLIANLATTNAFIAKKARWLSKCSLDRNTYGCTNTTSMLKMVPTV